MTALGLTWDHPRGRDALVEIARRANAGRKTPLIEWTAQPLEGFESAPIAELAAARDLLVLDHPHIGEAVAENCLIPLEDLYPPDLIRAWSERSVGTAMRSYQWGGRSWALPLDVAAQVMARRPGRIGAPPRTRDEIETVARSHPVAQSLAGPHALLTLFSLCAAENAVPGGHDLLPNAVALPALDHMRRLYRRRPRGSEALNPIALLEAMARDELALCPLIFGYVTYSQPGKRRIAFSNPVGDGLGGVLGGTGLAFTRRAQPSQELRDHVASLMEPGAQTGLIPSFGAQPALRAAWTDAGINARWGGFYDDTLRSVERAVLRPRFDGYVAFQSAASQRLRDALETAEDPEVTLAALRSHWTAARARARGPLDDESRPT
mgnify:CR=1 FL=1